MADEIKKNQIKYKDTVYTLEDARIPDPSGKNGKILGVNSNGQYELRDESSGGGSEGGGSSGGAVTSVNGKTGVVNLTAEDVGALPSSYQAPVTSVNGQTGDVVISGGGSGTTISVDSALSNESTNPVQNKVIKAAFDNKVDKVTGKSLSTNDFTNTYKNTLDNLDTTLSNKQDKLKAGNGIIISNNEISATGSGGSVGSLEWIELKTSITYDDDDQPIYPDTEILGLDYSNGDFFEAFYCSAIGIVRFTMRVKISLQAKIVNNIYYYEYIFADNYFYKPYNPDPNGTAIVPSSGTNINWWPSSGVISARVSNFDTPQPVFADLGYTKSGTGSEQSVYYSLVFKSTTNLNNEYIVASGFYYTENLPS